MVVAVLGVWSTVLTEEVAVQFVAEKPDQLLIADFVIVQ